MVFERPNRSGEDRMVKESGLDVSEWFRTVMDMCRFANPKEFTHTNTYQFAKNLYEVLFRPETSGNVYDRIGERMRKQFPDGRIFSDHPSGFSVMSAPAEEEFIQEIRMAVTKDADYASCMYDGAPEVLRFLLERGTKTVIFTNGDHVGIPDLDLPGQSALFRPRPKRNIRQHWIGWKRFSKMPQLPRSGQFMLASS